MTTFEIPTSLVGYARVSSDAQDVANSIQTQSTRIFDFANQPNARLSCIYKDEARTGTVDDRPGFLQMIADSRKNPKPFDAIVVTNFARFARNKEDSVIYKGLLKKLGIRVISIEQPNDGSPEGQLMEGIFEAFDSFYSASLGRNIRFGIANLIKSGFYPYRKAPFGYEKKPVQAGGKTRYKLAINQEQAVIIRMIFNIYQRGLASQEIHKDLNAQGIPAPNGGKWAKSSVYRILRHRIYNGTIISVEPQPGRVQLRFDHMHPAIIPDEPFEDVQRTLDARSPNVIHPRQAGSKYLLSNLAKCNLCGANMVPRPSKGNAYVYWVCQTRHDQGVKYCDCPRRNVETFEPIVLDAIIDDILTPTNVMEFIAHIEAEVRDQSGFRIDLIDTIDKQLDDLEQRFNRLTDAYETGKLTLQVWEKRIDDLNEKKQQLADTKLQATAAVGHELRILQDPDAASRFAAELKLCLTECEPAQLKTLIRKFVKQVRFDHDKAIIDYKIPLPDDSQNSGKISREIDLTGRVRPIVPLGPLRSSSNSEISDAVSPSQPSAPLLLRSLRNSSFKVSRTRWDILERWHEPFIIFKRRVV